MKRHLLFLTVVALTQPAAASECLDDVLKLAGWSARAYDHGALGQETSVTLGLKNLSQKDIVMLEGTATFVDALGDTIAPFPAVMARDVSIPVGTPGVTTGLSVTDDAARLATVDKDLVTASICVTGVVFADRTILRADAQ